MDERTATDLETTALHALAVLSAVDEQAPAQAVAAVRELARRAEQWRDRAFSERREKQAAEADRDRLRSQLTDANYQLRTVGADRDRLQAVIREHWSPSQAEEIIRAALATPDTQPVTHGRHCPCSACAREDWTRITGPCGMHGADCPAVYAPLATPDTPPDA